jgi:hypothetical protein
MKSCGTCSLCCKVLTIEALAKPPGQWCPHVVAGRGCGIHGRHPQECQVFRCAWLDTPELDETWKPEASGMVLRSELEGRRLCIDVDPARPNAWRDPPYYPQIKTWSQVAAHGVGEVVVLVDLSVTVVFPEADVAVGQVDVGDQLWVSYRQIPGGRQPWVRLIKPDGTAREVGAAVRP